jgi:hypothetical protein
MPLLLAGDSRRLAPDLLDERRDDEPSVAEDVGAVHGVLRVTDFGEPAAAGLRNFDREVPGDDDCRRPESPASFSLLCDL